MMCLSNPAHSLDSAMDIIAFHRKIQEYFINNNWGRIKTISNMSPWEHGMRYHVECTLQREYIVYEERGKIKNVGIYKKEFT